MHVRLSPLTKHWSVWASNTLSFSHSLADTRKNLYVETWEASIELEASGLIRSIGVSNFTCQHIERLIEDTGVVPAVNQLELHPHFQQCDVRDYHHEAGIAIQSYSPLVVMVQQFYAMRW